MRSPLNAKTALVGGMLASIGASACCVGPLLLLSLGLGLAFRQLYFVKQSCDSDANCATERTRKAQRLIFWIAAPLLLGLAAVPWLMPLFYH